MERRIIGETEPGERHSLKDLYSQVRDGSSSLQPGERLSWEQEIPKTDHLGETDHRRARRTFPRPGARNPQNGSFHLQPGERLSWEQEIPRDGSLWRDGSSARRTFQPPARRALLLKARNPRDGSLWRDGSLPRDGSGERLSWEQELSWSETDHCRDGSFHRQPGEPLE